MPSPLIQNLERAVAHQEPAVTPVAIWDIAPFVTSFYGIATKDYYHDAELKLKTQLSLQNAFPDAVLFPGVWADYALVVEASAFGCKIRWYEDDAPFVDPVLNSTEAVFSLQGVDVKHNGLMPSVLSDYEYFWGHLPRRYIEDYGYLDGVAFSMGPLELAAELRGFTELLLDFYDSPRAVHSLFRVTTDTIVQWLREQERVNGRLKRIFIVDHLATQVSGEHFEEFGLPYLQEIFREFSYALCLWHNEGSVEQSLHLVPEIGVHIFHYGMDAGRSKAALGGKVCLMGNLDPLGAMRYGSPEEVFRTSLEVLDRAAPGGGCILSTAGGMAPGTPRKNIQKMLDAVVYWHANKGRGSYAAKALR